MERPSKKELFGKLRDAKAAVRKEDVFLIDQDVIAEDAMELGYDIGSELMEVLRELLEGTSLNHWEDDPAEYSGIGRNGVSTGNSSSGEDRQDNRPLFESHDPPVQKFPPNGVFF